MGDNVLMLLCMDKVAWLKSVKTLLRPRASEHSSLPKAIKQTQKTKIDYQQSALV